jgi:hypothetical protein
MTDRPQSADDPERPLDIEFGHHHLFVRGRSQRAQTLAEALIVASAGGGTGWDSPGLPPPPSSVEVFELRGPQALLSWQSVLGAARYRVLRDRAPLEPPVEGHGMYVDETVRAGASYFYAVASEAADGRLGQPSSQVQLALSATRAEVPPESDVQLRNAEEFDPGYTIDTDEPPWAGLRFEELVEETPLGIGELLQRRGPIMATLASRARDIQLTRSPEHRDWTFLTVPLAADASLSALNSPPVVKGLSEFVGDLGDLGAGLVFRIER